MRKKIMGETCRDTSSIEDAEKWLDLDRLAEVEVTSEQSDYPIENALVPGIGTGGWRAAGRGRQILRLTFDEPQNVSGVVLEFVEKECSRTQEFVLRWCAEGDEQCKELVRQQYNFNPSGSTHEKEELTVQLQGVKTLELEIIPNISGGEDCASLSAMRVIG